MKQMGTAGALLCLSTVYLPGEGCQPHSRFSGALRAGLTTLSAADLIVAKQRKETFVAHIN